MWRMLNIDSKFLLQFLYLIKLEMSVFNATTTMAIFVRKKERVAGGVIMFCVCLHANMKQSFQITTFVCLILRTENGREISLLEMFSETR